MPESTDAFAFKGLAGTLVHRFVSGKDILQICQMLLLTCKLRMYCEAILRGRPNNILVVFKQSVGLYRLVALPLCALLRIEFSQVRPSINVRAYIDCVSVSPSQWDYC